MGITIKIDPADPVEVLDGIDPEEMAAAAVEGVTEEVFQRARSGALGLGSALGPRIARSLRSHVTGMTGEVTAEGADGYIGLHVHAGGPVRSRNGKVLAIPTQWNDRPDLFASDRSDLKLIRSKRKNRAYLFKNLYEAGVIGRPLFVLTPRTKPQRPRPWWPDEAEVKALADAFMQENF